MGETIPVEVEDPEAKSVLIVYCTVHLNHRSDIDGLRAIAVLAVLFYHAGIPGFSGGFTGVDVFFVLSGFLITGLLKRELEATGRIDFASFWSRRMRRLLPAFFICTLATLGLLLAFAPGLTDRRSFPASIKWAGMGLSNLFFKRNTGGYFDGPSDELPLLHFWSLAVEEQFYLFWPFLMWASARRPKSSPIPGVTILTLLSFAGAVIAMNDHRESEAFYLMPYRAWELGIGALAALVPSRIFKTPSIGILGALLLAIPIFSLRAGSSFPGIMALPSVAGTAFLLLAGGASGPTFQVLSHPILTGIGRISYSLYLWHWPVLVLLRLRNPDAPLSLSLGVLAIGASFLAGWASTRFVETPIRSGAFFQSLRSVRVIGIGIFSSFLLIGAAFAFPGIETRILAERYSTRVIEQIEERSSLDGRCFQLDEIGAAHCSRSFGRNPETFAVWGDSHAQSYFPMIEKLARETGSTATQYCLPQTPPFSSSASGKRVIEDLLRRIREQREAPIVILAARWVPYTGKTPISAETRNFPNFGEEAESLARMQRELDFTIQELERIGVRRIILALPYPEFRRSPLQCKVLQDPCETPRSIFDDYRDRVTRNLTTVARAHPGTGIFDPASFLCTSVSCPEILDGTPVVFDSNHPSVEAARMLSSPFKSQFLIK